MHTAKIYEIETPPFPLKKKNSQQNNSLKGTIEGGVYPIPKVCYHYHDFEILNLFLIRWKTD